MRAEVPLKVQSQQRGNWCWIAVASSVSQFMDPGSTWTQCALAQRAISARCCSAPRDCDQTGRLEHAFGFTGNLRRPANGAVGYVDLFRELQARRPVAAHVNFRGPRHYVLVTGAWEIGGRQWVHVEDPLYASGDYTFWDFVRYGGGEWIDTYYVKRQAETAHARASSRLPRQGVRPGLYPRGRALGAPRQ